jgi:hypothetical protein
MNVKTLLILTAVLAALTGAGVMMMRHAGQGAHYSEMGDYLIRNLPVNDIDQIRIEGADRRVLLEKQSGRWVVDNRAGYPADFSRITDFVRALRDAKTGRRFEASPETRANLSLVDPSNEEASDEHKGTRVRLLDKEATILADLLLGSPRKSESGGPSGGRYVSLEGASAVYLVNEPLALGRPSPADWLDTLLLDIPASKIKSIACEKDGVPLYRFERDGSKDPFKTVIFPSGRDVDEQAVKKLSGTLASFRIEDVIPASELTETEFNASLGYHLFDGRTVWIRPGETADGQSRPVVRISVDVGGPAHAGQGSGQDASDLQVDEETAAETARLRDIVSRWGFVLSEWRFESLVTDPQELVADENPSAS